MEPITRREMYLAALAGQKTTLPQPITREEHYLEAAVENIGHSAASDEQIEEAVSAWLDEHIDPTTGYAVDNTLTVTGAAADAAVCGTVRDTLAALNYVTPQMYGAAGDGVADDTGAIRAAVNSGKTVYIPAGHYKVRVREAEDTSVTGYESGIHVPSNTSIIMDAHCYLEALPTSYGYYQVFMLRGVENVLIKGGNIVGERQTHNYDSVHYRTTDDGFGIQMIGASHVTIDGVTISDCWGDGITIGRGYSGETWEAYPDCEDITICNCDISQCNRHGLSPTRVNNLLVDNCVIHDIYNTSDMPTATWYGIDDECLRRTDYGMLENHVYRNITFYGNTNKDFCANGIQGLTIDRCHCTNLLQVDTSDDVALRNSICDTVDFSKISQNLENIPTVKIYKSEINGSLWLGLQNATIDGCAFVQTERAHRASIRLLQSADGGGILVQNSLLRVNNDEAGIISASTGLPDFMRCVDSTLDLIGSIPYLILAKTVPIELSGCTIYENGLTTSSLFYRCDNLALVNCNVHFARRFLFSSFNAASSKLKWLSTTFFYEGSDQDILMYTHNESGVDHPIDILMVGNAFVNFRTLSLKMYGNTKTVAFEHNYPSTLALNYT